MFSNLPELGHNAECFEERGKNWCFAPLRLACKVCAASHWHRKSQPTSMSLQKGEEVNNMSPWKVQAGKLLQNPAGHVSILFVHFAAIIWQNFDKKENHESRKILSRMSVLTCGCSCQALLFLILPWSVKNVEIKHPSLDCRQTRLACDQKVQFAHNKIHRHICSSKWKVKTQNVEREHVFHSQLKLNNGALWQLFLQLVIFFFDRQASRMTLQRFQWHHFFHCTVNFGQFAKNTNWSFLSPLATHLTATSVICLHCERPSEKDISRSWTNGELKDLCKRFLASSVWTGFSVAQPLLENLRRWFGDTHPISSPWLKVCCTDVWCLCSRSLSWNSGPHAPVSSAENRLSSMLQTHFPGLRSEVCMISVLSFEGRLSVVTFMRFASSSSSVSMFGQRSGRSRNMASETVSFFQLVPTEMKKSNWTESHSPRVNFIVTKLPPPPQKNTPQSNHSVAWLWHFVCSWGIEPGLTCPRIPSVKNLGEMGSDQLPRFPHIHWAWKQTPNSEHTCPPCRHLERSGIPVHKCRSAHFFLLLCCPCFPSVSSFRHVHCKDQCNFKGEIWRCKMTLRQQNKKVLCLFWTHQFQSKAEELFADMSNFIMFGFQDHMTTKPNRSWFWTQKEKAFWVDSSGLWVSAREGKKFPLTENEFASHWSKAFTWLVVSRDQNIVKLQKSHEYSFLSHPNISTKYTK